MNKQKRKELFRIEYEGDVIRDDPNLSDEHLLDKEKRVVSMERQKIRKRRLLNGLSQSGYKPSIGRGLKWDEELDEYIYTDRVRRQKTVNVKRG